MAAFRRKAEKMIRDANPGAADVTIVWTRVSRPFPLPGTTGLRGRTGAAVVGATGYAEKVMRASYTEGHGWEVS